MARANPRRASDPVQQFQTIATFDNTTTDGAPYGGLIVDANGNLFGTTIAGGNYGGGTIFEITNAISGYAPAPNVLIHLNPSNSDPLGPLGSFIADSNGNLYATSAEGGTGPVSLDRKALFNGTVFEVAGSGFVPPTHFAGTPATANCTGTSVSSLSQTYGGISHAASSLGYSSVSALRTSISSYCGQ